MIVERTSGVRIVFCLTYAMEGCGEESVLRLLLKSDPLLILEGKSHLELSVTSRPENLHYAASRQSPFVFNFPPNRFTGYQQCSKGKSRRNTV